LTVTGPKGTLLCDVNKNVGLEIKTDTNEIVLKPLKEGREYFAI
jgi:ribosomal protein L6P/L9E